MERATEQAQQLAHQASEQVSGVTTEWRIQMSERSIQMRDRLTRNIRSLSTELRQVAATPSAAGNTGHQAARQGAQILDRMAGALDSREPGDWIVEARDYARQHPTQVASALFLSGLLAGRMGRSTAETRDLHPQSVDLRRTEPGYIDNPGYIPTESGYIP